MYGGLETLNSYVVTLASLNLKGTPSQFDIYILYTQVKIHLCYPKKTT